MAKTIRAYRISEENVKKNRMPNYNELMDGVAQISPVKLRNIASYHFHVLEDVKGNIYLTEDDVVMQNKLYERNLGVTETKFMIDGVGINQIKAYKAKLEEDSASENEIEQEVQSEEILTEDNKTDQGEENVEN